MKKNFKMRILVTFPFILIFVFVGTNFVLSSSRKEIQIVSTEGESMPLTIKDKIAIIQIKGFDFFSGIGCPVGWVVCC